MNEVVNFKRKLIDELERWRHNLHRKPLILRGARQVGKSTLINDFGKEYKYYISLNLERSKDQNFFLNYGDDVNNILEAILLDKGIKYDLSNTLLFIDEIQELPIAIKLLRYFYEDLPELHVITAGSLLEFAIREVPSFPVGRVQQMVLHPFDFEEFLMALDQKGSLEYLRKVPLPDVAFEKLLGLYNKYLIIGGMPEVIKVYISNRMSLIGLDEIYSSIWDNYKDDVEKYADNKTARKIIRHIMATAPMMRERISYAGFGGGTYKSREVSEALQMLDQARIIKVIHPTTNTSPPQEPNLSRKPKLQFLDTGLLNYACEIQSEMLSVHDFNSFYKGFIVNHMINQELMAQNKNINYVPRFWVRENANSNAEVDIVYRLNEKLIPIEVKSGAKGRLRSLHEYIDRTDHNIAVRFLANKVSIEEGVTRNGKKFKLLNLPYFCTSQLGGYLEWVL